MRVVVATDSVEVTLYPDVLTGDESAKDKPNRLTVTLTIPISIKRCGYTLKLLVQGQKTINSNRDPRLITHLSKAHDWLTRITTGGSRSIGEIAAQEGITNNHVTRMIYRVCLAPDIIRSILDGTHPAEFTSETLKQNLPLPIDWNEQRKLLGFPQI
jgi:hypothetical protein